MTNPIGRRRRSGGGTNHPSTELTTLITPTADRAASPPGLTCIGKSWRLNWRCCRPVEVKENDDVVATGAQLHHVLAERNVLHLIYAGFATNWCLLGRDYGIRRMAGRGYNIIALRECTTGVEFPDTLDNLFVTEIGVREIEQQFGFTASNQDFVAACRSVSDAAKAV